MSNPHVMMVPFPAHGHVIPLLELAKLFAKQGIRVTFVNTDVIHDTISMEVTLNDGIRLVSVPDGLESRERFIPGKLTDTVYKLMPSKIKDLIVEIDESEGGDWGKITCVVYDQSLGRIWGVAREMGLKCVAFSPAAAALLILGFSIPKMIEDGIIDARGVPLVNEVVQFAPTMPLMIPSDFVWHRIKIPTLQKIIFEIMVENIQATKSADWLICNSAHGLEPGAFTLAREIIPVGPFLGPGCLDSSTDHFFKQDSSCLEWLDQQPLGSVVYVAFGSSTMMSSAQLQELAHGLERANRPFLWVIRANIKNEPENRNFQERFLERVSDRGKIVGWAPQKRVLSHSSVACFITHCGWNSTVESVSSGVPMLCWPYFADQFINQSYVCDIWKVGVKFEYDASGDIVSDEIKTKIDQLLGDRVFKERALCLKEMMWSSAGEGGSSYKNLKNLINWIQEQNC